MLLSGTTPLLRLVAPSWAPAVAVLFPRDYHDAFTALMVVLLAITVLGSVLLPRLVTTVTTLLLPLLLLSSLAVAAADHTATTNGQVAQDETALQQHVTTG